MNKPFVFKQFTVKQDRCAMKIGTDGVLLGAWVDLENQPDAILDIGAGTGIIALMLAQRSVATTIDALEIDEAAYIQCVDNFEASHWSDRLFCYHADLEEFLEDIEDQYELIVSNPPFYSEDVASASEARDRARQTRALPFEGLIAGASAMLTSNGVFATIIPFKEEAEFTAIASKKGLFPKRITRVKGNASTAVKRSLMEFVFKKSQPLEEELIIEKDRHVYTADYIALTKEFYLKM